MAEYMGKRPQHSGPRRKQMSFFYIGDNDAVGSACDDDLGILVAGGELDYAGSPS